MGVELRDENCQPERQMELSGVAEMLIGKLPKGSMLSYLDTHGDTVFNARQLPVVIEELQSLLQEYPGERGLVSLLAMAQEADASPHTYLVFTGD